MGLNRTLERPQCLDKGLVVLTAGFTGNGSSAPTGVEGKGVSVARTGTGVYVVTLPGTGSMDIRTTHVAVVGTDFTRTWVSAISEAARTVTITSQAADGTPTDLSSSQLCRLTVWAKNSTVA